MRKALFWSMCLMQLALAAQDQDMVVTGTMRDAITGEILSGTVDAFDETDTSWGGRTVTLADGTYDLELYTYDSSYYVVSFEAPGHVTRRAVFDMTTMKAALDMEAAWEIRMDVPLWSTADAARDGSADDLLGHAVFDNEERTVRWTTPKARAAFPVKRTRVKHLGNAVAIIDSLQSAEGLLMSGLVRDHWTEQPIAGVNVVVTAPGGYEQRTVTDDFGLYGLTIPYDRVYRVTFSKPGLVNKVVELDNTNIPDADRPVGYRAQVDMRLFEPLKGEDLSFLDEPIGKARYDRASANVTWDMDYTRARWEQLQQILDRHPNGR